MHFGMYLLLMTCSLRAGPLNPDRRYPYRRASVRKQDVLRLHQE